MIVRPLIPSGKLKCAVYYLHGVRRLGMKASDVGTIRHRKNLSSD